MGGGGDKNWNNPSVSPISSYLLIFAALSEQRIQASVSLSFGLIFIVIGIPLWWNTTKVYRASLPYSEIELLNQLKVSYMYFYE